MTIKGRRFRLLTGRTTSPRPLNDGRSLLQRHNVPESSSGLDLIYQLKNYQVSLKPIRAKKRLAGNPNSDQAPSSIHTMYVQDYGGGAYGYIRA